uniref:Hydroxysteroid (17-beta) dehydrogenase 7 n=1 Tax=Fundulus heteroclitus TaxID=8078 RepID=A0A3Q2Q4P2_FUNHE
CRKRRRSFPSHLVASSREVFLVFNILKSDQCQTCPYSNVITMFATGEGILAQKDAVTPDGLQQVFATNLFGHFLLVRELEPVLCHAGRTSLLVWTSSSNAHHSAFNLEDMEHRTGTQPYSSSKYATDLLSLALNQHYNKQGLYSSVICPGFVMTNLTYGILPSFPAFLMRTTTQKCSPTRLLSRLITEQKPESLDPYAKYHSLTSGLGNSYTRPHKMNITLETSETLHVKLLQLEREMRTKLCQREKETQTAGRLQKT